MLPERSASSGGLPSLTRAAPARQGPVAAQRVLSEPSAVAPGPVAAQRVLSEPYARGLSHVWQGTGLGPGNRGNVAMPLQVVAAANAAPVVPAALSPTAGKTIVTAAASPVRSTQVRMSLPLNALPPNFPSKYQKNVIMIQPEYTGDGRRPSSYAPKTPCSSRAPLRHDKQPGTTCGFM